MGQIKVGAMQSRNIQKFAWPDIPEISHIDQNKRGIFPADVMRMTFALHGTQAELCIRAEESTRAFSARSNCRIGDSTFSVFHDNAVLNDLATLAGFDPVPDAVPPQVAGLVMELLMADIMPFLETEFDGPLVVDRTRTLATAVMPANGFSIIVDFDGAPQTTLRIIADQTIQARLARIAMDHCEYSVVPSFPDIPVPVRLMGPDFDLMPDEMRALCAGDGIALDFNWADGVFRSARFGDFLSADLHLNDDAWCIRSPLIRLAQRSRKMSPSQDTQDRADADLAEMPVTVSIELARTQTRLSDLKDLVPGSVVPFETDLPQQVKLLANGAVIATGELVKLNNKIAVRIRKRF